MKKVSPVRSCTGCLVWHPPGGNCIHGNEPGDEWCLRDRKLNLRADYRCLRDGCLSAQYTAGLILVCNHQGPCLHVDGEGFSRGCIIDAEESNRALRLVAQVRGRTA